MVLEGFTVGALLRVVPEVLRWLDRYNERSHELKMIQAEQAFQRARWEHDGEITKFEVGAEYATAGLGALQEGIKAAAVQTGVRWIDGANALVRPVYAYLFLFAYLAVKMAAWSKMQSAAMAPTDIILALWNTEDAAIFGGIVGFYFLNRVIDKGIRLL